MACSPVGVQWESSGPDQTGLDSSGLGIVPANLAWQIGPWNPVESSGVHVDYVGEGKDLSSCIPFQWNLSGIPMESEWNSYGI